MPDNKTIAYDIEGLRPQFDKLKKVSDDMQEIKKELNHLTDYSDSYWIGPAGDKYRNDSERLYKEFSDIGSKISLDADKLNEVLGAYEKNEQKTTNEVDDLSTENIF